jgi:hypothetical protein
MPSRQRHRGRHPQDDRLFAPKQAPRLRSAVADLSYLYTRGYSEAAAVTLVGDRYQLTARQRRAVQSAACSDDALRYRIAHAVPPDALRQQDVCIDGYNLLISVESALSGAFLFRGRDGYLRDLASLHGSYRSVAETRPALELIGEALAHAKAGGVHWYFDAPVSNSGRLRAQAFEVAAAHGWRWDIDLSTSTDQAVAAASGVVISTDSWILDRAARAFRCLDLILQRYSVECPVVELNGDGS